ncbi:putative Flp pilus-assembly TadE/G-like protein [Agromyces ramosus]|uniref:Putative Flp pilus-assembly TadE/G-like protein n=1 Tax=Agromyces ramosus TaxID=33879 RepID=A0A4Q7MCF9_9MICO|nr:pilus assembly protein TadG-related protein [Agromyces ramosus]RZS65915.1 putative Flp pilus-assembly TadE/G-like protein [Agromyces ramosus]
MNGVTGSHPDRGETGSTLLLTIFYCFLGLSIVLVVVSATTLYLERKRLFTLADGAAVAAAEAWSLERVRLDGDGLAIELDSAEVRDSAAEYLAVVATDLDDVELVAATSVDGRTATVTLRSTWEAPLHTDLVPLEVPIEVTVTARSVFH